MNIVRRNWTKWLKIYLYLSFCQSLYCKNTTHLSRSRIGWLDWAKLLHVVSEIIVTSAYVSSLNTIGSPLTSIIVVQNDLELFSKLTTSRYIMSLAFSSFHIYTITSATDMEFVFEKHCDLKWPLLLHEWHMAFLAGHWCLGWWLLPEWVHFSTDLLRLSSGFL